MQDYTARSTNNLIGVDSRLRDVFWRVFNMYQTDGGNRIAVISGRRTVMQQAEMVAQGSSRTMNSRHIPGKAIDIGIFSASGEYITSYSLYKELAYNVEMIACDLAVTIEWGGVCFGPKFKDGDHFQIPERFDNVQKIDGHTLSDFYAIHGVR